MAALVCRLMSGRGKRKAKAVEEEEKEAPKKEEKKSSKKKDEEEVVAVADDVDEKDDEKQEEEVEGDNVGEKERLKIIKARRKQLLDDIRDEQNKTVAAAQVSLSTPLLVASPLTRNTYGP